MVSVPWYLTLNMAHFTPTQTIDSVKVDQSPNSLMDEQKVVKSELQSPKNYSLSSQLKLYCKGDMFTLCYWEL